MKSGRDFAKVGVSYEPLSLAISTDASLLAIGGDDNTVHIHNIPAGGGDCAETHTIKSAGAVSDTFPFATNSEGTSFLE